MDLNLLVPIIIVAALLVFVVISAVRVVPQARRYNVERFGRYRTTLQPGLNFIIPLADRINNKLDVREQVYSSHPQPVITEDNLVVNIDTVLYYQITDPRAAAYEVANYLQGHRPAHRHHVAQRHRQHGSGADADLAGGNQRTAAHLCWTRRPASGESG
jgi:regulator of protease activity HflC (stomatin/prohibitin superfamily)